MSIIDWAENEIKIACKKAGELSENGIESIGVDYYISCCDSALKAYKCLFVY